MAKVKYSVEMDVDNDDIFEIMDTLGVSTVEELQGALKVAMKGQFSASGEISPDSIQVDVEVQPDPLESPYLS